MFVESFFRGWARSTLPPAIVRRRDKPAVAAYGGTVRPTAPNRRRSGAGMVGDGWRNAALAFDFKGKTFEAKIKIRAAAYERYDGFVRCAPDIGRTGRVFGKSAYGFRGHENGERVSRRDLALVPIAFALA